MVDNKNVKLRDDADWDMYTDVCYEQAIFKENLHDITVEGFSFGDDNEIIFSNNLHPNHKELYHQVHSLGVKSIYECGCGAGYHLINIYNINNNIDIGGCDYARSQIDLGVKYFNIDKYDFFSKLQAKDFSISMVDVPIKYEFVYTQAVTQHLRYDKAKRFLNNMKLISNKYVFLTENINEHDYDGFIKEIFPNYHRTNTSKYIDYGILLTKND